MLSCPFFVWVRRISKMLGLTSSVLSWGASDGGWILRGYPLSH